MARRRCLFALFLLLPAVSWGAEPVFTADSRFRIPYESDPAELARLGARQVRLYVSRDRGASWTLAKSVEPDAGEFGFGAPSDGEYWFAVRTVDQSGRLYPPSSADLAAGLKVIVDTHRPTLRLTLRRLGDRIQLTWRASDPALAAKTLRLEVRHGAEERWRTLPVTSAAQSQTSWPAPKTALVVVRGSIADHAGNRATAQEQLGKPDNGYPPLPERPELEGPIAQVDSQSGRSDLAGAPRTTVVPVSQREPVEAPIVIAQAPNKASEKPASGSKKSSSPPKRTTPRKTAPKSSSDSPPKRDKTPAAHQSDPAAPSEPANSTTLSRPGEAQLVGSRAFELAYQIEEVGPSGIGAVTFYITEDGGRTWYRYGQDKDRQSPYSIQVPRAGSYGFAVRVRSGVGLGQGPPRGGEEPAFRVIVDETPPQVSVSPPTQHAGEEGPVVRIKWKVTDRHPSRGRSVSIDYATTPEGPWKPIAREIENAGQFDWQAKKLPGGRVFIRVRARDAAGNVGSGVTTKPVVVDFIRPQAQITNVKVRPSQ